MDHRESAAEACKRLSGASFEEIPALLEELADDPRKQVQKALAAARKRHQREQAERDRVLGMYAFQNELGGEGVVLGVDEVGRGAVAGPLTVCAVALPPEPIWGLNDSKQLTPQRREELAQEIAQRALAIGIAHIPPESIDAVGMATSLRMAMAQAIQNSGVEPDAVIIDGNPVHVHEREVCVVKGDARVACVAAASICAKVCRDDLMRNLSSVYPGYHLDECKGYASADHIAAIRELGLTPIHRSTFCDGFLESPRLF